ncbi:MAG: alpha-mannosidase [Planctomycetota bacterium]
MRDRVKGTAARKTDFIEELIYVDAVPIEDVGIWETTDHVTPGDAAGQTYRPCEPGDEWGGPWQTAWFRLRFRLPPPLAGRNPVARIAVGGEGVAFIDGVPVIGLNRHRDELPLGADASAGQGFEVFVEAGANDDFGRLTELPRVRRLELAATNETVRQLAWDLRFLLDVYDHLDPETPRAAEIIHLLERATNAFRFDAEDPNREAARVRGILRPLFRSPANASATEFTLSGHAHIDVAWKWPLAETTRKCARTFSSVVHYMQRYPDFRFTQTQAYLYETTRERYPALYRRIAEAVDAGQWEVSTAMYVEADQNVPSGESLVRQLLFGKRFARDEFGVDVTVLVLPDVFGYNAQLPQLLRKAGIDYFTTQKISWNDTNLFPFNSFVWEGLDGSEVLTHFLPSHNYNARVDPRGLIISERRHSESGHSKPVLYQYGHGDGGGGPTPRMIEFGARATDFEGLPRCRPGFIREFFERLAEGADDLPRWVGEFYLELHRATYTTQGRTKKLNRRCELALRDAELLGAIDLAAGGDYEQETLNDAWRHVLLNQFHDVLPGSSIREVYELTEVQLAGARDAAAAAADTSARSLAERIDTRGDGRAVVIWNTLAWPRPGLVTIKPPKNLKDPRVLDADGEPVPVQRLDDGRLLVRSAPVPAMGYEVHRLVSGGGAEAPNSPLRASKRVLENERLLVRLNRNGELTSVFDKAADREVLRGGRGNELELFEDHPMNFDAWDIEYCTRDQRLELPPAESVEVVESGPVRAAVEVRRRINRSALVQRIMLTAGRGFVEFETEVDWDESHKLLKVAFPVDVRAAEATYEVQFGSLRRPTHRNTSWDAAKFEVCGQRWADLSETGYGVSLLNDCKYGHDIHANVMRLTLLRAPKQPDPTADLGHHAFRYALFPHAGDHVAAATVRRGAEFNVPLRAAIVASREGEMPTTTSFFAVDSPHVVLDTVKKAEDDDALIVRLYEAHGGRARATLTTSLPVASAAECDLLERATDAEPLAVEDGAVPLDFGPFEVKTLRLA